VNGDGIQVPLTELREIAARDEELRSLALSFPVLFTT
jgi:hypothetical protein